jgi:thiamine-phosphate pyrophosphorylase
MTDTPSRLYLATPKRFEPETFATVLAGVLVKVPVACVRIELGDAPEEDWTRAVNHLLPVCHNADVALVVAEHFRMVEPLGLDGVHLGTSRTPIRDVRKALGPDRIIGASAGTSRHQGMILGEAGADYVAFGPVGETGMLGDDARAEDGLFQWWAEMIEVPSVAEGGVTAEDAARLAEAVDFVVPDVRLWDDPDPVARITAVAEALG